MKNITLVSPIYYPETNAGAKRSTAMAEHLAQHGWHVTVLTLLPHHPQNRIYDSYDVATPKSELVNGVRIHRFRPWIVPKSNLILRLLSETIFAWHAFLFLLRHPSDVILATCPYIATGPFSLLASKMRRSRFVWDVRDLTWSYPRAAGKRTFNLDKLLAILMKLTARHSDVLSTATDGLLKYFIHRPQRAVVLPNGVDQSTLDKYKDWIFTFDQERRYRVLYAGLFGYNHGLDTIIEAAKHLPNILFVMSGDGPERNLLEKIVQESGLSNVIFTGYLNTTELQEQYRQADILVSHVRRNPLFYSTQPAKLWEYMATGKPVIHAGEGEVVEIVEAHQAAVCILPEEPLALADAIRFLLEDPERAAAIGRRGKAFVWSNRNRPRLLGDFRKLLDELVE